jgi:hypothetical protein
MKICDREDCFQHEGKGCGLGVSNLTECLAYRRGFTLREFGLSQLDSQGTILAAAEKHHETALQLLRRATIQLEDAKRFALETFFTLERVRTFHPKQEPAVVAPSNKAEAFLRQTEGNAVSYCIKCKIDTRHQIHSSLEYCLCCAVHQYQTPKGPKLS